MEILYALSMKPFFSPYRFTTLAWILVPYGAKSRNVIAAALSTGTTKAPSDERNGRLNNSPLAKLIASIRDKSFTSKPLDKLIASIRDKSFTSKPLDKLIASIRDKSFTSKPLMLPSFSHVVFDTMGERRLASRLLHKLPSDYIIWCNIPVGPRCLKPDFVLLHPFHGLLVLEVKDYNLGTILEANKVSWTIKTERGTKRVKNPLAQARQYAEEIARSLQENSDLVVQERYCDDKVVRQRRGQLVVGWNYGVVFTGISRKKLEQAGLDQTLEDSRILCKDEMATSVDVDTFTSALQGMCHHKPVQSPLSPQHIQQIRGSLFPELRLQTYHKSRYNTFDGAILDDNPRAAGGAREVFNECQKSVLDVMDFQQEQVARNMGKGHRVLHGVAGSGKTILIGYRARELAKRGLRVLVVCFNQPLSVYISDFILKDLSENIEVTTFHKWCRRQLIAHDLPCPADGPADEDFYRNLVDGVLSGVETGDIPRGQYDAILVDEAHDFEPSWLKLLAEDMLNPATQDLLVVYDDAQNIYRRRDDGSWFTWKSVGVQAQGRTSILHVNYRNTIEILKFILQVDTENILSCNTLTDEGAPSFLEPVAIRPGPAPQIIAAHSLDAEVNIIVERIQHYVSQGFQYGDMAILCVNRSQIKKVKTALENKGIPSYTQRDGKFNPLGKSVKVMTIHSSKGLEFPVVALVGVGDLSHSPKDVKLLNVGCTRSTQSLIIGVSGDGGLAETIRRREGYDADEPA